MSLALCACYHTMTGYWAQASGSRLSVRLKLLSDCEIPHVRVVNVTVFSYFRAGKKERLGLCAIEVQTAKIGNGTDLSAYLPLCYEM